MYPKFVTVDWIVLCGYFTAILALGFAFYRRTRSSDQFTAAGRSLPGWLCGLSIFATYLSSISYLALPGKAFTADWNPLVSSLALPLTAWIAVRFFLPYYRSTGYVSAYAMLEKRFGLWARIYASGLYLLYQIARMGVVMYLMALPMAVIFGWDMRIIILLTGIAVTVYAWIGGIVAVIWADAIQAIVLMAGAGIALFYILQGIPGGVSEVVKVGFEESKFSLGDISIFDLSSPTILVVLLYGFFENLRNFGIDQSYIQRYIAAENDREGRRSVWIGALTYIPVSALFLFIGTSLFAYYKTHSDELPEIRSIVINQQRMQEGLEPLLTDAPKSDAEMSVAENKLGDQVFPHFIATHLPPGITGLLVAAIFAAAMSTVSTSLNSSATLVMSDFYQRFKRERPSDRNLMIILHLATAVWGFLGTWMALVLIRYTQSALDTWWTLSSILGAGLVGLFLAGLLFPKLGNRQALLLVLLETVIVGWMTFSKSASFPPQWSAFQSPLHPFLTIVVGTFVILIGAAICTGFPRLSQPSDNPHTE